MKLSLKWVAPAKLVFARAAAWRWSKPLGRSILVITGLLVLALIGRATLAGAALASRGHDPAPIAMAAIDPAIPAEAAPVAAQPPLEARLQVPSAQALVMAATAGDAPPAQLHRGPATPEDPVVLNDATVDDFERLPGIGLKRAEALLALRARLGKFRQVEDLLKVKGIGLKTLRKLRPLVRLDAPPPPPTAEATAEDGGT